MAVTAARRDSRQHTCIDPEPRTISADALGRQFPTQRHPAPLNYGSNVKAQGDTVSSCKSSKTVHTHIQTVPLCQTVSSLVSSAFHEMYHTIWYIAIIHEILIYCQWRGDVRCLAHDGQIVSIESAGFHGIATRIRHLQQFTATKSITNRRSETMYISLRVAANAGFTNCHHPVDSLTIIHNNPIGE
jgi:hypothetical protein